MLQSVTLFVVRRQAAAIVIKTSETIYAGPITLRYRLRVADSW